MISGLLKFWPALLPLAVFVIWYIFARRKLDIKVIDLFYERQAKYRFYTIVSTAVIFAVCAVGYILTRENNTDAKYIPAKFENGQLVPAHFEGAKNAK